MNNFFRSICTCIVVSLMCSRSSAEPEVAIVDTLIRVTVQTEHGDLISDAPVQVSFPLSTGFGFTDAQGVVEIPMRRASTSRELVFGIATGLHAVASPEQRLHANDRYNELFEQYALAAPKETRIDASAAVVDVNITVYDAIRVRGRVVQSDGAEFVGAVAASDMGASEVPPGANGVFECFGARKSRPVRLLVADSDSQAWVWVFGAEQTGVDLEVGPLTISRAPATAEAKARATNGRNTIDAEGSQVGDAFTLVSSDGQVLYVYGVNPQNGAAMPASGPGTQGFMLAPSVKLAPGTYFAVPGPIGYVSANKLIDLIRANRLAELNAANVPKFTAVEGQTVEFTFDMAAALAAIQGIPDQPTVVNPPPPEVPPGP